MTFLVDVNLPEIFPTSDANNFIYVFNVDRELSDSENMEAGIKIKLYNPDKGYGFLSSGKRIY
jgi:hypothetical protein